MTCKNLRWNFLRKKSATLTILAKRSIIDFSLRPKCASEYNTVLKIQTETDSNKYAIILINYLHLMFRSVNCLGIRQPLKRLPKVSVWCSTYIVRLRIFVRSIFYKSLSKHLWGEVLVKFHDFSLYFSTHLNGCVWSMKIILWGASYSRHWTRLAKPHCKHLWKLQILFR